MKQQMLSLHQKYTSGKYPDKWLELTFTHTEIVLKIALQFAKNLEKQGIKVNLNLLKKGVYLHDIGVYSCYDEDINSDKNFISRSLYFEKCNKAVSVFPYLLKYNEYLKVL